VKILLVQNLLHVPALRAANRANRGLIQALAGRGHECRAVAPAFGPPECRTRTQSFGEWASRGLGVAWASPDADVYPVEGVDVHVVQDPSRLATYGAQQVRELRPDWTLVTSDDPDLTLLAVVADAEPAKLVCLYHSDSPPSPQGLETLGRVDGVAVPGEWLREELQRWTGREAAAFAFPSLGYEEGPFPRPTDQGTRGTVTLVNPSAAGGLALFLELARRRPDADFAAVPGWATTDGDLADLEALRNVMLLETSDDFDEVLTGTRMLLLPTLQAEGFEPLTVEAMLRGIPVLASGLGGLVDAKLGVDFLLPPPADPERDAAPWEEALDRLLADQDLFARVSAASQEAARAYAARAADLTAFEAWCEALIPRPRKAEVAGKPEPAAPRVTIPAPVAVATAAATSRPGRQVGGAPPDGGMHFSLFFFSADGSTAERDKYRLLLESARFADRHGFTAIWTPERHFNAFGGLYPNPSVTSAALAMVTERIQLRAGSVVMPLQNPLRVAEEWALVDNLSGGRVALAFASGWHVNDFAMAPGTFQNRRESLWNGIELVRRLWRGEPVELPNGLGKPIQVEVFPRPLQEELPFWITCQSDSSFVKAGETGANVLTNMNQKSADEFRAKAHLYRDALSGAGYDPAQGVVSLMLHTYVTEDVDLARDRLRSAYGGYLLTNMGLQMRQAEGMGADVALSDADREVIMESAFQRLLDSHGLVGTPQDCVEKVARFAAAGVNEIACLIDFGLETDDVLRSLHLLAEVKAACAAELRGAGR
jgi:natural product biosynthesis luciferase-like monooxygenase protein